MAQKKTSRKPARKASPAKKTSIKKPARKASAKSSAERAKERREPEIYKVSPLRGMPVDAWIASKTTGWQSDVVRRVVAIVKRVAPEATCSIKWAQPVFELGGPFAFVKP